MALQSKRIKSYSFSKNWLVNQKPKIKKRTQRRTDVYSNCKFAKPKVIQIIQPAKSSLLNGFRGDFYCLGHNYYYLHHFSSFLSRKPEKGGRANISPALNSEFGGTRATTKDSPFLVVPTN